jgi:glycosyltransferase involved in cell wall biosynthesis
MNMDPNNHTDPSITVVIPTADRGKLLNRALRSVLGQTVKPGRIIVVDNGASEAEIDSQFIDQVQLVRTIPRIGAAGARNKGAGLAKSHYVAFLDDDDIWEPGYLEHALKMFNSDRNADVVVGRLKRAGNNQQAVSYKMFPSDIKKQRGVYYKNPGFGGQNIIIKKELFLQIGGYDESLPPSEDRDLAARILQVCGRIVPQPESVAVLCDHDEPRARHKVLYGNKRFIVKHWKNMSVPEFLKAVKRYVKKIIEIKMLGSTN